MGQKYNNVTYAFAKRKSDRYVCNDYITNLTRPSRTFTHNVENIGRPECKATSNWWAHKQTDKVVSVTFCLRFALMVNNELKST